MADDKRINSIGGHRKKLLSSCRFLSWHFRYIFLVGSSKARECRYSTNALCQGSASSMSRTNLPQSIERVYRA